LRSAAVIQYDEREARESTPDASGERPVESGSRFESPDVQEERDALPMVGEASTATIW
jgi:hypothetical protein